MSKEIHQEIVSGLGKLAAEIYSKADNVPSQLYDLSSRLVINHLELFIVSVGVSAAILGMAVTINSYRDEMKAAIEKERQANEEERQLEALMNPETVTIEEERLKVTILVNNDLV